MMAAEWRGFVRPREKAGPGGARGEQAHAGKSYDVKLFGFAGYVGQSGVLGYAPKGGCQRPRRVAFSLRYKAVARSDAVVLNVVRLCVLTSRIWLNGPQTEHVDPAVEARHGRYDVDGIHGVALAAECSSAGAPL
jgi:hypothetical protein